MYSLYTIILEYAGGTYITQLESESEIEALISWAINFNGEQMLGIKRESWVEYTQILISESEIPVAISNCSNVWCSTGAAQGKLVLVNIIRTERRLQ